MSVTGYLAGVCDMVYLAGVRNMRYSAGICKELSGFLGILWTSPAEITWANVLRAFIFIFLKQSLNLVVTH